MKLESKRILKIKRNLYQIAVISLVVVLIWIGFEIYWSYNTQPEISINQASLQPISSELYLELAQKLTQKQTISPQELNNFAQTIKNSRPVVISSPNLNSPSVIESSSSAQTLPASNSGTLN